MQPAIVMPMHDPDGQVFPHLGAITPDLKQCFERAFVSIPVSTRKAQPGAVAALEADDFFRMIYLDTDPPAGDHFLALYNAAATACPPEQVLHLCFPDRVSLALQTGYRAQFMADIREAAQDRTPLVFHRSEAAWNTHPRNYRECEQMVITAGEWLFHKTVDFVWCHVAFRADQLRAILPRVKGHDLSIVAEMILLLIDRVQTQEVDWLAWEDPFILSRDPRQLKDERECSEQETCKRLSYVIPILQLLYAAANGRR